jgi:hypothetical protein
MSIFKDDVNEKNDGSFGIATKLQAGQWGF